MSEASLKAAVRKHEDEFEHDVALDDAESPQHARCRLCSFSYDADGNRDDTPENPDGASSAAAVDPVTPTPPTGAGADGETTQPGPTPARKRASS